MGAVLYARAFSAGQKVDLDRQVARLAAFAAERGLRSLEVAAEVGSGLNGRHKGLLSVPRSPGDGVIVGSIGTRPARFGSEYSEYIEASLAAMGRKAVVVDPEEVEEAEEVKDDLIQDVIDVLGGMCARLYGRRSARQRAEKALKAVREP